MNCSSFCAVMSVISSRPFHGQLLIAAKRIDNVDRVDVSEVRAMLNQVLQVLDRVQVMLHVDQASFRAVVNRCCPADGRGFGAVAGVRPVSTEEHTSELLYIMRISSSIYCL